ncbi:MAG: transposase, partial [Dysosmobacter sp.]|nr:transposase [Dysosmobacter sp.]
MPEVFIPLAEAASFEGVKYNTLVQCIKRNSTKYQTKTQPRASGGKDEVLISVSSLSAKGRRAWRAAQKVEGGEAIVAQRTE